MLLIVYFFLILYFLNRNMYLINANISKSNFKKTCPYRHFCSICIITQLHFTLICKSKYKTLLKQRESL